MIFELSKSVLKVREIQKQLYLEYFNKTLEAGMRPFSFTKWLNSIYSSEYLESHADPETAEYLKAYDEMLKE